MRLLSLSLCYGICVQFVLILSIPFICDTAQATSTPEINLRTSYSTESEAVGEAAIAFLNDIVEGRPNRSLKKIQVKGRSDILSFNSIDFAPHFETLLASLYGQVAIITDQLLLSKRISFEEAWILAARAVDNHALSSLQVFKFEEPQWIRVPSTDISRPRLSKELVTARFIVTYLQGLNGILLQMMRNEKLLLYRQDKTKALLDAVVSVVENTSDDLELLETSATKLSAQEQIHRFNLYNHLLKTIGAEPFKSFVEFSPRQNQIKKRVSMAVEQNVKAINQRMHEFRASCIGLIQ